MTPGTQSRAKNGSVSVEGSTGQYPTQVLFSEEARTGASQPEYCTDPQLEVLTRPEDHHQARDRSQENRAHSFPAWRSRKTPPEKKSQAV